MIEIISYLIGFLILIAFLYFMWIDTKPLYKNNVKKSISSNRKKD